MNQKGIFGCEIRTINRRKFLSRMGAGALGAGLLAVRSPGLLAQNERLTASQVHGDNFSRLFDRLPPFAEPSSALESALMDIGAPGGIMDAHDPLDEGPVRLITIPGLSERNPDSTTHTAGITFLGQFLDHDMTFDTTSTLGIAAKPEESPNARTSAFDLDSVYGSGPVADSRLYQDNDRDKFRVESGGLFEDLPREANGRAIIADPRNDENMMISGLQVAFLLFHNRIVDTIRAAGRNLSGQSTDAAEGLISMLAETREGDEQRSVFAKARRVVTWHYQWIIINEFLPQIIGASLTRDILTSGRRFYNPRRGQQAIPVEFQGAAY